MKFACTVELTFSRDVSKEKSEIEKALASAEKLLLKGTESQPSEGAKIAKSKLSGDKLLVEIESGGVVRAHSGAIRLRNHLNTELGKVIKAGIRAIEVKRFSITGIKLPQKPLHDITILHFVKSLKVKGSTADVELVAIASEMLEDGSIDRLVNLIKDKAEAQHYAGKGEVKQLLWESSKKKMQFDKDPAAELEKLHWIKRTSAKAQFVYGASFTSLLNAFKSIIFDNLYKPMEFEEYILPKFEPWEVPSHSGHAKSIYPEVYYVFVPRQSDPKAFESESDYFRITGKVLKTELAGKLESVGIMSYAQCPPLWRYFQGRTIASSSLPIKLFDWSGPTYRNEAGGTQGITRVEEIHRVETLWVGTPEQCTQIAEQMDEKLQLILDKLLELEVKKYWVTPWFLAQEGKKVLSEEADRGVGTKDYEAYLPFRGPREKSEWLEICNISVNGEKYPSAFSVKAPKGELWSGCSGIGLDRWAAAFLSQKGLDPANWPREVAKRFNPSKPIEFL